MNGDLMKKLASFLASALALSAAMADPVPKGVESAIKNLSLQSWSFRDGKLRLVMDRRTVSKEVYSTAVNLVCGEQWREPAAFERMWLERIEVLNYANAQGFALLNANAQCRRLGKATGASGEMLIQDAAVKCEAGVCRARN